MEIEAQILQALDQPFGSGLRSPFVEVIGAEFAIRFLVLGQMIGDDEDRMCDGDNRLALARYARQRGEEASAPLFPSPRTGDHLTAAGLLVFCRKLGERANVPHCSPHTFRRTFATWALDADMDLDTLRRVMGHNSFVVLQRYLSRAPVSVQNAYRGHAPVDKFL